VSIDRSCELAEASDDRLRVYWRPGCTSCLRTKEYLTRHGIPFVSINVIEDEEGFRELERFGIKRVPIVRRGDDWIDGQAFADLARIAGIHAAAEVRLPPKVLLERGMTLLSAARRFVSQIPDARLDDLIPNRPRSFRQLAYHLFEIYQFYLDWVESGRRLEFEDYDNEIVPVSVRSAADLERYGRGLQDRFAAWWLKNGDGEDYGRPADVYYGKQTMHEFFERTVWHSGQHTRQIQMIVERLGLVPDGPLSAADIEGLPMPEHVFDDKLGFEGGAAKAMEKL
jgi:glutaredoxin